jgi:hypothetical protein
LKHFSVLTSEVLSRYSEILEIRQHHPNTRVVNVVFPSNWKQGLMPLTRTISTLQIELSIELSDALRDVSSQVRASRNRSLEQILAWLDTNSSSIVENAILQIRDSIKPCLKKKPDSSRWARYGVASAGTANTKIIYNLDCLYKKGLIALSLLSPETLAEVLAKKDANQLSDTTKEQCQRIGVIIKEGGYVPHFVFDEAVVSLRTGLTSKNITAALDRVRDLHSDDEFELTGPVRGSESIDIFSFLEKVNELRANRAELEKWLKSLMAQWGDHNSGSRNLPLDLADILAKNLDSKVSHRIVSNYAGLPMIGGVSPLPKFLYGKGVLSDPALAKVAEFFARLFSRAPLPSGDDLWVTLLAQVKDKLIKHKYVNYLHYLCVNRCEELGLTVLNPEKPGVVVGNKIAEYCRTVLDLDISSDVANTKFSFEAEDGTERYVFLVISAYDATHKHKEYPGRWRCATVNFDSTGFKWSDSNANCVVVLDGVWKTLYKSIDEALSGFNLPGISRVIDAYTFFKSDFRQI